MDTGRAKTTVRISVANSCVDDEGVDEDSDEDSEDVVMPLPRPSSSEPSLMNTSVPDIAASPCATKGFSTHSLDYDPPTRFPF